MIAVVFVKLSVPQNFQMDTKKAFLTDVPKKFFELPTCNLLKVRKTKFYFEIEKVYLRKFLWKLKSRFWPHRLNFLSIAQFCWLKICKKFVEMTFLEEKYFEDFFRYSRRKIWEHWKKFFFKSSRNYWSNTKVITFLFTENLISSKTSLKNWRAFMTTLQKDFHKNTGNFRSGRRLYLKLNVSRRKCSFLGTFPWITKM